MIAGNQKKNEEIKSEIYVWKKRVWPEFIESERVDRDLSYNLIFIFIFFLVFFTFFIFII
ncbi:hypothetical protein HanXRQr2_Chr13g0571061 [Helianthus annuus]|uniref:Uncharacterized protein n=1 Tax=Helianthus annuus TaxID=4232 RepID=A0A9K3H8T5_HELAN|nr:hypothetical protein HanXRQr2_Chr13g0571061 [Helianthus annuus]